MDAAGLQCARPTGIGLRGEDLICAGEGAEQAMDRIQKKFEPDSIGPAAVVPLRRVS